MRLSAFCESCFCLIRCWMGVLFHLLPRFPRASPSALYRTSSMPVLLSLSLSRQRPAAPLCSRRDPAWLPWRPGVTHCKLRPGCNRTHVALLCLTCTLYCLASPGFSLFQTLSNIGGILCESALNEKADECMQTGSPNPSRELNPRLMWI